MFLASLLFIVVLELVQEQPNEGESKRGHWVLG